METKTTIIAALIVAATTAMAIAPIATLNAMAAPNGSTTTCVHNGNGADKCTGGSSSTTVTCTKVNGKYVCSSE
jgi:hypothetical protein